MTIGGELQALGMREVRERIRAVVARVADGNPLVIMQHGDPAAVLLRFDEDLSDFYRRIAADPDLAWATAGAGRMVRGATVFEGQALPGEVAFRLYDTYGFPLDLTEDVLRARGLRVDVAGFEAAMARQREEARRSWSGSGEQATEAIWFRILGERGPTEFVGYEGEDVFFPGKGPEFKLHQAG